MSHPCIGVTLLSLALLQSLPCVASFSDGEEILGCLLVQRKVPAAALKAEALPPRSTNADADAEPVILTRLENNVEEAGHAADAVSADALSLVNELSRLQASLKKSQVTEAVAKPLQHDLLETLEAAHAMLTLPVPATSASPAQSSLDSLLSMGSSDDSISQVLGGNETTATPSTKKTWQDTASLVLCFGGLFQPQTGVIVWAGTSILLACTLLLVSAKTALTSTPAEEAEAD
ncbi:unnamed protein product [Symbiodinium microadriaticum]|nr:unnamed protein product [Symbiodinium microadriaticum]